MFKELLDNVVSKYILHELDGIRLNLAEDLLLLVAVGSFELLLNETRSMLVTAELYNMVVDVLELVALVGLVALPELLQKKAPHSFGGVLLARRPHRLDAVVGSISRGEGRDTVALEQRVTEVLRVGVHEVGSILRRHSPVRVLVAVEVLRVCLGELLRLDAAVNVGGAGFPGGRTDAAPDIRGDGVATTGAVSGLQAVGGRGRDSIDGTTLHGRHMGANGFGG